MPCRMTAEERRLEVFETPAHYVEPLLELVGPLHGLTVYEPCVGRGHIARYLIDCALTTNDIDPAVPATTHLDARLLEAWPDAAEPAVCPHCAEVTHDPDCPLAARARYDWTITNPPFSEELPILWRALQYSRNVAFLARLSFLEPTRSRTELWRLFPPTDVIILPRYSFRLNEAGKRQTDNVTCCWLVWREGAKPALRFSAQREWDRQLPPLDDRDEPLIVE